MMNQNLITFKTSGQGLYLITDQIREAFAELPASGMLQCFLQHTSASLVIQENSDRNARTDLEEFLKRVAPEGQSWHRHLDEGPDDTTAHQKASILQPSLLIPIYKNKIALGTWQGIYLWEHRKAPHERRILLTIFS